MGHGSETQRAFVEAARWTEGVVATIADDAWSIPALGDWNLRSLVGHTARALSTVRNALAHPAEAEELPSPEAYYRAAASAAAADPEQVRERGVAAGQALGAQPREAFRELVELTVAELRALSLDDDPLVTSVAGGIRLSAYLPTRVFELVVHGLDICRAVGREDAPPLAAQRLALGLAGDLAAAQGLGPELLLALTGRSALPHGFTVL